MNIKACFYSGLYPDAITSVAETEGHESAGRSIDQVLIKGNAVAASADHGPHKGKVRTGFRRICRRNMLTDS